MRVGIVTNIDGMKGLQRDYYIMRRLLMQWGHEVVGCQFDQPPRCGKCDLVIFLETVVRDFFEWGDKVVCVPNPEWWLPQYEGIAGGIAEFWVKTKHAGRVFSEKYGPRVKMMGFMASDRYDPLVPRERKFLHVCGNSSVKNTQAVLSAWTIGMHQHATLVGVGDMMAPTGRMPNVEWHGKLTLPDLQRLQNQCLYHLIPSMYEGFGHALHEAFSVGAIVLTVNHPPMNEWPAVRVMPEQIVRLDKRIVDFAKVGGEQVASMCQMALRYSPEKVADLSRISRSHFDAEVRQFAENLKGLIG